MPKTKQLMVELSKEACSVIIIGVGNAEFDAMEELDGDGALLRDDRGYACQRDIVQFVEFREAMKRGNLAEQVLKEVPEQVCSHYEKTGYKPQAVVQDMSQFAAQAQNSYNPMMNAVIEQTQQQLAGMQMQPGYNP